MPKTGYTFWLAPAAPLKAQLTAFIKKLADDHGAVPFAPHITLYFGPSNDDESIALARRIIGRTHPLELTVEGLAHTRLLSKTLFVQFRQSALLRKITETIRAGCVRPSRYELNPHLSLLYKTMPKTEQTRLCRTLKVPQGRYAFDALEVLEMETPFRADQKSIGQWRRVFDGKLKA